MNERTDLKFRLVVIDNGEKHVYHTVSKLNLAALIEVLLANSSGSSILVSHEKEE